jgi:hypothetical protein
VTASRAGAARGDRAQLHRSISATLHADVMGDVEALWHWRSAPATNGSGSHGGSTAGSSRHLASAGKDRGPLGEHWRYTTGMGRKTPRSGRASRTEFGLVPPL